LASDFPLLPHPDFRFRRSAPLRLRAILRARIADLPLQEMLASGRCDVLAPAVAIWPDANATDAATLLTGLLSNLVRSQNGPPCSAEIIGKSPDAATSRLGTTAAHAYATALARQSLRSSISHTMMIRYRPSPFHLHRQDSHPVCRATISFRASVLNSMAAVSTAASALLATTRPIHRARAAARYTSHV
jgi:hypothetical protein